MKPDEPFGSLMSPADADISPLTNATAAPILPVTQRILHSRQLFGATNEVLIEHAGFTYRLRITSANKLILTK